MALGEELFIAIVGGSISGLIVGIFLLCFGKIKWNSEEASESSD